MSVCGHIGNFTVSERNRLQENGDPDPLFAAMGERKKGYQHKMLGKAFQGKRIEKSRE